MANAVVYVFLLHKYFFVYFNMTNLQDLPDLIIHCIIKLIRNGIGPSYYLKKRLPLLAICSKWRQVGLPVIYDTLFFCAERDAEIGNGDLYTNSVYRALVNNVIIPNDAGSRKYSTVPSSLVEYLKGLSGLSSNGSSMSIEAFKDIMPEALDAFAVEFPNINSINFGLIGTAILPIKLSTQLVEIFRHQLISLEYRFSYLLDLAYLPNQLTCLHCSLDGMPAGCLPKINPTPLKDLWIENCPDDFPLLFSRQPYSEDVVFPNLRELYLNAWMRYPKDLSESGQHAQTLRLHFPNLKYLGFVVEKGSIAFAINPASLPDHLERLELHGDKSVICQFGNLPLKSIGHIKIIARNMFVGDTEDFFRVTNSLLSGREIAHDVAEVKMSNPSGFGADFEQVRWCNISKLEIIDPRYCHCFSWLKNVPSIRCYIITYTKRTFGVVSEPDTFQLYPSLKFCKVERLVINNQTACSAPNYLAALSIDLMRSLRSLKKVYISEPGASKVWIQLHKEKKKYPHFKNIEVTPILK